MPSLHVFVKMEVLCDFVFKPSVDLFTITIFAYVIKTKNLLYLFLHCSFMTKQKNTVNVLKISAYCFLFLKDAYKCSCSPITKVIGIVPEHLYTAMTGSLRQQFYPRMRQAA